MINLNEILVGGRLTRDPELRHVGEKKTAVASFSVAVDTTDRIKGEDQKSTQFFNCEVWFGGAETLSKEFKKGNEIVLVGAVKTEKWEKDGVERSRDKVRVSHFGKSLSEVFKNYKPEVKTEAVAAPVVEQKIEMPEDGKQLPF